VTSDLRSQVLWCSTEGLHRGSVGDAFFAEAKVGDLDVAVFVQHEVLQLKRKKHVCFHVMTVKPCRCLTGVRTGAVYLQITVDDLGRM